MKLKVIAYISAFNVVASLTTTQSLAQTFKTVSSGTSTKDKNLKMKLSGVPAYNFAAKQKNIPLLSLGTEKTISADSVPALKNFSVLALKLKPIKVLPMTADRLPANADKIGPASKAVQLTSPEAFKKIPDVPDLAAAPQPKINNANPKLKDLKDLQANDYKLIQALIFLEVHKKYELAMSLLAELFTDKKHSIEAQYNYALTAKGLQLNTEFRQYMMNVAKEGSKEWKEKALDQLTSNTQMLELPDVGPIDAMVEKSDLDVTGKEAWQIYRAQFYSDKGDLGRADDALGLISEKSSFYPKALMMSALLKYRLGQLEVAQKELKKSLEMTKWEKADPMRSLAALTLGRMHFQRSEWSEAYKAYLEVDRNSSHWLQAMTEQAWTQILSGDYEGAAGNMFSLHTDYFKAAFSPETYVIRTVGYLNLCQYGDSMHVLQDMKKKYGNWKSQIDEYQKIKKSDADYYDTFKLWAQNPDLKNVDGLPRSFIVELARHPSFLSIQKQINNYDDEITRFNNLAVSVLRLEKKILEEQALIMKKPFKSEAEREDALEPVKIQLYIAKKARTAIKEARQKAVDRLESEKTSLKNQAAKTLVARFKELQTKLNEVLDQNEVLAYEIYSGAGEHIRYQMAGGEINDTARPELKAEAEKSVNWKFKGEIWEDEIGHYRSSLKNVCAKDISAN